MIHTMKRLLFFLAVLLAAAPARADCVSPPGVESQQMYNYPDKVMQYCDGDEWVTMNAGDFNDLIPAAGPAISAATTVNCSATILPLALTCTAECPPGYWRSGCFATLGIVQPVGDRGCHCATPDLQCTAFCLK